MLPAYEAICPLAGAGVIESLTQDKPMQLIHALTELRSVIASWRREGHRIAFVPTMGALHAGHLTLVEQARQSGAKVVVSVFVNPLQFAPNEDFSRYPRTLPTDADKLRGAAADLLYAPEVSTIYPEGFATTVQVNELGNVLCGSHRPGHFDGVTTVVAKLFNQVQPDTAYFGEKDFQQLTIIRRMARDMDFSLHITGVPTVREADGLALSSRNQYLGDEERRLAPLLFLSLSDAAQAILSGEAPEAVIRRVTESLRREGFHRVDYFSYADSDTLQPLTHRSDNGRLFVAAHLGTTRLIDNLKVSQ